MRARAVQQEVSALAASWQAGDRDDPELRRSCLTRLEALRALWRTDRALFGSGELLALRELARAIESGPRNTAVMREPERVLREVFGHASFRPGQQEIIEAALAGRDCVGVMPTGGGKSLTYQIPARMLGGTTLVVSPLIALMKDQVDAMARLGIRATFLNSSVDPEERRARVQKVRRGEYELLYAAPEGLEASVGAALANVRLSMLAVDEAHCISHWGHDFRPAYRNLRGLKARFGGIPVLALTATATAEVTRDIVDQLGMSDPLMVRGTFYRPNLRLHAYRKGTAANPARNAGRGGVRVRDALLRLVRARKGESGIVYALSRRSVDATAEAFRAHGVRARPYHAGMEPDARSRVQDAFQSGAVDVVVATVAFGMGIDKPDIRYVLHRDMPRSLEGYYQEIGRAGRDGNPSDCVLFYSWVDVIAWDRLAESDGGVQRKASGGAAGGGSSGASGEHEGDGASSGPPISEIQRRQVREMYRFAEEPGCRHRALVRHFGERIQPCGGSCDLCAGDDLLASIPSGPPRRSGRRRRRP